MQTLHEETRPPEALEPAQAIWRVLSALPPTERAYAGVRFTIVRRKLLTMLDLALPSDGRVLDLGSGFGLFAAYFALVAPRRVVVGVEPSRARVAAAARMAARLGIAERLQFTEGTVQTASLDGMFDGIHVLDVLHHVPAADQRALLRHLASKLAPGGTLVVKEVTTDRRAGVALCYATDWAMGGVHTPICYRHHDEWTAMLREVGLRARAVRVVDIIPYPHVVIVAQHVR